MHCACALLGGYVVAQHAQYLPLQKRMSKGSALQLASAKAGNLPGFSQLAFFDGKFGQRIGNNVDLAFMLQRHVLQFRMKCDCHRSRQRPGSGGPDDGVDLFAGQS